jgi:hypothetical protein
MPAYESPFAFDDKVKLKDCEKLGLPGHTSVCTVSVISFSKKGTVLLLEDSQENQICALESEVIPC